MNRYSTTLAEIVAQQPHAARVLSQYHLDFCCHGQRSLEEACREKALDPAAVLAAIDVETPVAGQDVLWSQRPLAEVVQFIVNRYHAALRVDLPILVRQARLVEHVHADRPGCPVGLADHLEHIEGEVEGHLAKEEQILFPLILQGRGQIAQVPVKVMEQEHVEHGNNLAHIRSLTGDLVVPAHACATWTALYNGLRKLEQELFDHIHLENYVLFPRALRGEQP